MDIFCWCKNDRKPLDYSCSLWVCMGFFFSFFFSFSSPRYELVLRKATHLSFTEIRAIRNNVAKTHKCIQQSHRAWLLSVCMCVCAQLMQQQIWRSTFSGKIMQVRESRGETQYLTKAFLTWLILSLVFTLLHIYSDFTGSIYMKKTTSHLRCSLKWCCFLVLMVKTAFMWEESIQNNLHRVHFTYNNCDCFDALILFVFSVTFDRCLRNDLKVSHQVHWETVTKSCCFSQVELMDDHGNEQGCLRG